MSNLEEEGIIHTHLKAESHASRTLSFWTRSSQVCTRPSVSTSMVTKRGRAVWVLLQLPLLLLLLKLLFLEPLGSTGGHTPICQCWLTPLLWLARWTAAASEQCTASTSCERKRRRRYLDSKEKDTVPTSRCLRAENTDERIQPFWNVSQTNLLKRQKVNYEKKKKKKCTSWIDIFMKICTCRNKYTC